MTKMRKLYWYLTAYIKKHGTIVLASVIGAIAIFSFLVPSLIQNLENRTTYYVGLVGDYSIETLPPEITNKISAGLTEVMEDGSVEPLVAQRWNSEQDGKVYRFILKENILFTDGEELETEDIQYNFPNVETIITPNDIVFKLPDPFAPFPVVVSEPILKTVSQRHNLILSRPMLIGVGPYEILDYSKQGDRITEMVLQGNNERYVYRFYLTEKDAITAFKHGEVDILPNLSDPADIGEWETTQVIQEVNFDSYLAIFFDLRNPLFTKNIRQALAYAIQKPTDESRAIGPISPNSWAYLPAVKGYQKDMPRGIERLLDEPPQAPLEFTLTTTSTYQTEAEQYIEEWNQFSEAAIQACQESETITEKSLCDNMKITVNLKITNFPDTSNFELLLIGQQSPPDPDQYALWHSDQSTNFTGYKNIRIDSLLERGRQTTDFQERIEIYQEFQQFFLEDAPAIFIKHLNTYAVQR